jgi:predicted nucleotidyltransferase
MKRTGLIQTLKSYDSALREIGATALYVFGSRARGDDGPARRDELPRTRCRRING